MKIIRKSCAKGAEEVEGLVVVIGVGKKYRNRGEVIVLFYIVLFF